MNRDLINKVLYYGTLAPSAHNTQPWKFKTNKESIVLSKDSNRVLGYSDTNGWETILSLGACLTNLVESSKALGLFSELKLFPNGKEDSVIAEIFLTDSASRVDEETLEIIESRQTNRANYQKKEVSKTLIKRWIEKAQNYSTTLIPISESSLINQISELHKEATEIAFADPKFRKELSGWVRNSLTKKHDGMPGYSTNIPFPASFIGPWLIKNVNIGKMQGSMEKAAILSSPLLIILLAKVTNTEEVLSVGRVFEEIALDITREDLVYAPLGALIEAPEVSKDFKRILRTEETPLMLIRVGYSDKKYKRAPKRTVVEVVS